MHWMKSGNEDILYSLWNYHFSSIFFFFFFFCKQFGITCRQTYKMNFLSSSMIVTCLFKEEEKITEYCINYKTFGKPFLNVYFGTWFKFPRYVCIFICLIIKDNRHKCRNIEDTLSSCRISIKIYLKRPAELCCQ